MLLIAATALLVAGCNVSIDVADRDKPRFLEAPGAAERQLPFSEAVRAGDFLFLAGQIGLDPETMKPVTGGIVPESLRALNNIRDVLERHGASLRDVVKCTVFLADMSEWGAFNDVYKQFFSQPYPARSALGANGLALGARVEVECIAYVPEHH
jgi:reactive intermediate/imine deaminase